MNLKEIKTVTTDKANQALELWGKYVTQERLETAKVWATVTAKVTLCTVSLAALLAVIVVGYLVYGLITAFNVAVTAYSVIKDEAEEESLFAFIAAQPIKMLYSTLIDYGMVEAKDAIETVVTLLRISYDFEEITEAIVSKVSQLWANLIKALDKGAETQTQPQLTAGE